MCFPSTFPSILLFFKVIGMLWLRKPSLHLPLGHALSACSMQLLFLLFLYGIPTFKDEGGKIKDLGCRFQSSAHIYASSPCLGQQDLESRCVVCWMFPVFEAGFGGDVQKAPFQRGSGNECSSSIGYFEKTGAFVFFSGVVVFPPVKTCSCLF